MRNPPMKSGTTSPTGRRVGFGVVRDKDGNPRIDGNPTDLPPQIQCMLSVAEREALGLWPGPLARDAQGVKRVERVASNRYRAIEPLVAVSSVFDDGKELRVSARRDVAAGGEFEVTGERGR